MHHTTLTIILVATLGACVASNGDEGILLTKNVAPAADSCVFVANETEPFVPHGIVSVLSASYRFHPQMKSRITALDDQIDQRTVLMEGARVDIAFADTALFTTAELATLRSSGVTHFESAFSAPLLPNGGITDAGFDLFSRDLIDAVAAKVPGIRTGSPVFRTELIAKVTVFGDLAGDEVTSQEFKYPVTLCNDCVVNNLGMCSAVPAATIPRPGNPCNLFQDSVVDCCTSAAGLVCPAVGTLMP